MGKIQAVFDLMLKTASGQPTKSESFDFGGAEFAPWVRSVDSRRRHKPDVWGCLTYRHEKFSAFLDRENHSALRRAHVYPVGEKYFASPFGRRSNTDSGRPVSTIGAFRDRHERGAGCDGRG
jgi:hypothetical protein